MQPSAAAAGSQQQPAGGSGTPGTALTGPPWLDARRVAAGGVVPPGIPARRRLHPRAAALRRCPGRPGRVAPDVAARPEPDRRRLALGCLLFFATAAAVLPVSDAFEFSWRYQLPALVTLPPADALGLACLARSARRRAHGGACPGAGRPGTVRPGTVRPATAQPGSRPGTAARARTAGAGPAAPGSGTGWTASSIRELAQGQAGELALGG